VEAKDGATVVAVCGVLAIYDATWSNIRSTSSYSNTGRQVDTETGLSEACHPQLTSESHSNSRAWGVAVKRPVAPGAARSLEKHCHHNVTLPSPRAARHEKATSGTGNGHAPPYATIPMLGGIAISSYTGGSATRAPVCGDAYCEERTAFIARRFSNKPPPKARSAKRQPTSHQCAETRVAMTEKLS
jgi:hypothetical protein